jgi:hypothetical protein
VLGIKCVDKLSCHAEVQSSNFSLSETASQASRFALAAILNLGAAKRAASLALCDKLKFEL